NNRGYDNWVTEQVALASKWYQLRGVLDTVTSEPIKKELEIIETKIIEGLHPECKKMITNWSLLVKKYNADFFEYTVRDKAIKQ
ncbi:hypothetical protein ACJEKX_24165, partial [Escherichia coli]